LRDFYDSTVNFGVVLPSTGFFMTPQVFRKLESETRQLFNKHTPPMTYISVEAPHRPNQSIVGRRPNSRRAPVALPRLARR
tara:strand:+ start:715 stop:957 length:243 start_codon:yes stop_codon:yes gene_type:complete